MALFALCDAKQLNYLLCKHISLHSRASFYHCLKQEKKLHRQVRLCFAMPI